MIGLTLGPYRILDELGSGGMGIVYRAEDVRLGRSVAIKVLPQSLREDKAAVERFHREARAAASLNHPAICTIHDIGEDQGHLYIAMELLEGRTLKQVIDRAPLAATDILHYALQITDALEAAHGKNVIHRDLKPANIFITTRNQAKVLDFGLAKMLEPVPVAATMVEEIDVTRTGIIPGTIGYMSPEQVRGDPLDGRSDLFSFGIVLYEMATGHRPFSGSTAGALFDSILHFKPRPPREINPAIPEKLDRVIVKALEKDRERRFTGAAPMRLALDEVSVRRPRSRVAQSSTLSATDTRTRPAPSGTSTSSRTRAIPSVAVLPFVNAGGDKEAEYLSDGMTESIIYSLARLPGLRVVPRTTAFRYKESDKPLAVIAREVKAKAIVTGRVAMRGQQLNVQAEMVDPFKDSQLWGERYTRTFADVFAVQEEMATAISSSLQLRLSHEDRARLAARPTQDSLAYEAYLKGRHHWNKRTIPAFIHATEYFQQAIDRDPRFTLAYAGLADTFNVLGYYNAKPPRTVYPRAKAAAARALEIDPTLAEAHASLAYATLFFDRDWAEAERHFHAALTHNPKYASAHQWYGWYLLVMERFDEMVEEMQHAAVLDPLSLIINDHLGYALSLAGRHDDAVAQLQRTLELDPNFSLTHLRLGLLWRLLGRADEGRAAVEQAVKLSEERIGLGYLGQAYGADGMPEQARSVLQRLTARAEHNYVSPLDYALAYDGLGEVDQVFTHLDRAVDDAISDLVRLKVLAWSSVVRRDPRFDRLAKKIGLLPATSPSLTR